MTTIEKLKRLHKVLDAQLYKDEAFLLRLRTATKFNTADFLHGGCIILTEAMRRWMKDSGYNEPQYVSIMAKELNGQETIVAHAAVILDGYCIDASGVKATEGDFIGNFEKEERLKAAAIVRFRLEACISANCPYDEDLTTSIVQLFNNKVGNAKEFFTDSKCPACGFGKHGVDALCDVHYHEFLGQHRGSHED